MQIELDRRLVRIDDPTLYQDPDFRVWLNLPDRNQATWHTKGSEPGEFSDLFVHVDIDGRDGSDSDMPDHCWDRLLTHLRNADLSGECLVWLSNGAL